MPEIVINRCRGASSRDDYAARLDAPLELSSFIYNMLLTWDGLAISRPSLVSLTMTSGPASVITYQLYRHQPAADSSASELWAFSSTSSLYRLSSGTWASVSASDTVAAWSSNRPYAATHNGKLYLAYNSNVNRLHLWDGTSVRRCGLETGGAATVANTGAGSYAAVTRYYRIQWRIYSGSDRIATSELSTAVGFTPSGSGTAARVTKPTTVDSATHWCIYASTDNVTYYGPITNGTYADGLIAVANTTFDDSTATTAYSAFSVAPTAGLYVPPPSCKYLLSADNRLFMAGAWETSAASTQTGVKNSRVWWTQINGALDETGEDEAIAQTTTTKDWIDIGENDGDAIVGFGGPLDGLVYVFKERSIWRLVPTGLSDTPYRADQITRTVGARWQDGIATGEDGAGQPAIYFVDENGMKRLGAGGHIVDVSFDMYSIQNGSTLVGTTLDPYYNRILRWEPCRRMLWLLTYNQSGAAAYQPEFEFVENGKIRGGWTTHSIVPKASTYNYAACLYEVSTQGLVLHIGGDSLVSFLTRSASGSGAVDWYNTANETAITRVFHTGVLAPTGGRVAFTVDYPIIQWPLAYASGEATWSLSAQNVMVSPTHPKQLSTGTVGGVVFDRTGGTNDPLSQQRAEGVALDRVLACRLSLTLDNTVELGRPTMLTAIIVPYRLQEQA